MVKDKRMFRTTCLDCAAQYEQESANSLQRILQSEYEDALKEHYPNAEIKVDVLVEVAGGVHSTKIACDPNSEQKNIEKLIKDMYETAKQQSDRWLFTDESTKVLW